MTPDNLLIKYYEIHLSSLSIDDVALVQHVAIPEDYSTKCTATRVVTTKTDGKAKFVLGNDFGVPVGGHTSLTFQVKSCGNVYVLLTEKIKVAPTKGNYYFISLGVTKSHRISGIIEGCYSCNTFPNYKLKTVLNCTEYNTFWVAWDGQGSVSIGREGDLRTKPLLQFKGKKKYPINFFQVTSYNFTAEFRFHLPCDGGTYGDNCTDVCGHCRFGLACDSDSGECPHGCQTGWTGSLCAEECGNNTYGPECTPCGRCRERCEVDTGRCPNSICQPGWVGDRCDRECFQGTYGPYCTPCGQCQEGDNCDVGTGHCPNRCQDRWTGVRCDIQCPGNTHGYNCTRCGHCRGEEDCDRDTGQCPSGCDRGWSGPMCNTKCKLQTYGLNCGLKCGHCLGKGPCDHVTGDCSSGCDEGWFGSRCKLSCPGLTYGQDCQYRCGHCAKGSKCHPSTGACADGCEDGWQGHDCIRPDQPNPIRISTESTPIAVDHQYVTGSVRADTIAAIILGICIALLMGVIFTLLWRRAVTRHESKYRANYNHNDGKPVHLDIPASHGDTTSNAFTNAGFLNISDTTAQM
ncbi:scavenger receptor class F member 1-like [Haliotis rubra]|uniref:scavenger receptor class F member 1-like n=1 Tax=Haliotis rubra TaxID=36100 RepID=UPI001EE563A6|nr:scavenger receptor class F member 1-like [Haliotis rubra]